MKNDPVKVAIVSDTHNKLDPRITEVIKRCDYVIHAGDIGEAAVLEEIRAHDVHLVAVCGNNDHPACWPDHEAHIVCEIPFTAELTLPGGLLVVEHGHEHGFHKPSHESLRLAHPKARVIVYGHTHKLVCDTEKMPWILNPGAAGGTRNYGGPSCLVLHVTEKDWRIETFKFVE